LCVRFRDAASAVRRGDSLSIRGGDHEIVRLSFVPGLARSLIFQDSNAPDIGSAGAVAGVSKNGWFRDTRWEASTDR